MRGLEGAVAEEVAERFGVTPDIVGHRDVEWSSQDLAKSLELRTADDAYLVAGEVLGVGRARSHLRLLGRAVHALPVAAVADLRNSIRGVSPVHLAVTASFLGRRNFSRFDAEDAVGVELAHVLGLSYRSRRVAPPQPGGLEWRVHIVEGRALLGLRVSDVPLHRRSYKQAAPSGTTHPPLAAAMVRLARIRSGAQLWDPTCGAGTIPIEARLLNSEVHARGSDIDRTVLLGARLNVAAAGVLCPTVVADVAELPLREGSVDALVANLPWGRQVARQGGLGGGHHILRIADRVVSSAGSVTLLMEESELPHVSDFELVDERRLSLMGSRPSLRVWRRQ